MEKRDRTPPPPLADAAGRTDEAGDAVETGSQDSFPASDPPSWSAVTRVGRPLHAAREE